MYSMINYLEVQLGIMNKDFILTLYSHRITKPFLEELAEIFWQNKGKEKVLLRIIDRYGDIETILELKTMKITPNLNMYIEILDTLQRFRFKSS